MLPVCPQEVPVIEIAQPLFVDLDALYSCDVHLAVPRGAFCFEEIHLEHDRRDRRKACSEAPLGPKLQVEAGIEALFTHVSVTIREPLFKFCVLKFPLPAYTIKGVIKFIIRVYAFFFSSVFFFGIGCDTAYLSEPSAAYCIFFGKVPFYIEQVFHHAKVHRRVRALFRRWDPNRVSGQDKDAPPGDEVYFFKLEVIELLPVAHPRLPVHDLDLLKACL